METNDLVSGTLGSESNKSSILNDERVNEISGLSGSYGAHSPKSLQLSGEELETLVVLASKSEKKERGVTAESIQEISDRLAAIKARSAMEEDTQTSRPYPTSILADVLTSLSQGAKWSDRVEEEQRSKLLDLPDSVEVAKNRVLAHQLASMGVSIGKSTIPPVASEDMEILDLVSQDLDLHVGVEGRSREIASQHDLGLDESGSNPRGSEGNSRGGLQHRGRGANTNYRGGRGGRGQYRATEVRSWAKVASASVRSEVSLKYYPPKMDNDKIVVEMPPSSPMVKWEACLVGYFIDKNLPYTLIKNNALNMWKNKGLVEILKKVDGLYFLCLKIGTVVLMC